MANRPHLLDVTKIATAPDGVHNDGGALDGCALEIHIRNGGKSKRAYFRYNGKRLGEKRTERISLGSYDRGLPYLRRERVSCEDLISQSKSPKLYRSQQQEQQRSAVRTLREAVQEFFDWAGGNAENEPASWHSPETRKTNTRIKKNYFDAAIMDCPVQSIRPHHLDALIGPQWRKKPGKKGANGVRMRSLLHSVFEREIDNENYSGRNPASWRKTAPLSRLLGPQPRSTPHPSALYTDIPRVVAHLRQVRNCVPGYLTVAEAAYALNRDGKAIRCAADSGKFPGIIMRPHHTWNKLCRFIPIADLKSTFGEFEREPIAIERADVVSNSELLQAIIFTAVRPSMTCNMYWGQIKDQKGYIEYLPARDGLPSEHKNGWKYDFPYLVILTDNLRAIIETQRRQQIRDGLEIKPHGLVFRHSRTHAGVDYWFGHGIGHRTLSDYLRRVVAHLDIQKKDMTPAGMRATFGHWAKEEHGYDHELIDLTFGHTIPAIRENPTDRHYLYNVQRLKHRRQMMDHWEQFCLSLCQPADNVIQFPASA